MNENPEVRADLSCLVHDKTFKAGARQLARCRRCGKPAGFLRSVHKECDQARDAAMISIARAAEEAAKGQTDVQVLRESISKIAAGKYVEDADITRVLGLAFERAVDRILEDGVVDENEEAQLSRYYQTLGLTQGELDARGAFMKFGRGVILREIMNGRPPGDRLRFDGHLPFVLQKKEAYLWVFPNTKYFNTKAIRKYQSGSRGASIRIAKGLYWRVGASQGYSYSEDQLQHEGTGRLAITNKHLFFDGPGKDVKIRLDKLATIEPLNDGIEVQRDAQTAKPQVFKTGDGWFTYNILVNAANVEVA